MKRTTPTEIMITYISLGWAFMFFIDNNLFDKSLNFLMIREIVKHEWVVGLITLSIAAIKMIGIVINNINVRKIGLIASALFWGVVAASMLVAGGGVNFSSGFVVYSGLAVLCFWTSKEVMTNDRME